MKEERPAILCMPPLQLEHERQRHKGIKLFKWMGQQKSGHVTRKGALCHHRLQVPQRSHTEVNLFVTQCSSYICA